MICVFALKFIALIIVVWRLCFPPLFKGFSSSMMLICYTFPLFPLWPLILIKLSVLLIYWDICITTEFPTEGGSLFWWCKMKTKSPSSSKEYLVLSCMSWVDYLALAEMYSWCVRRYVAFLSRPLFNYFLRPTHLILNCLWCGAFLYSVRSYG